MKYMCEITIKPIMQEEQLRQSGAITCSKLHSWLMVVLRSQCRFVRVKGTIFLLHCIKHKYGTPAICQHLGHMKFPVEWENSRVQGFQWDTGGEGL